MNKKIIFSSIITVIILWVSHAIILKNIGDSPNNIYLLDAFLFLYPPLIIVALSTYFFIRQKKDIAKGIIIGGLIYCFGLWFVVSWDISEMPCQRYFFNLLTNCPGIK